jgi:TolB protein
MWRLLVRAGSGVTIGAIGVLTAALIIGRLLPTVEIAFDSARNGNIDLLLLDAGRGIAARLTRDDTLDSGAAWSPDGQHIAYVATDPQRREQALMVMNWDGTDPRRLTTLRLNGMNNAAAAWSPDGSQIAFTTTDDSGSQGIYLINVDGTSLQRITERRGNVFSPTWSPDGRLAFAWSPVANTEIYVFDPRLVTLLDSHTTTPKPQRVTDSYYTDTAPSWSPTGEWIAFISDRTGSSDIYLMRPDGADLHPITHGADREANPAWSPDGAALAFVSNREGAQTVYTMNTDGSNLRRLLPGTFEDARPAWRPNNSS